MYSHLREYISTNLWYEEGECTYTYLLVLFPGGSHLQFWSLAVCKNEGAVLGESRAWSQVDMRVHMRPLREVVVPDYCNSQILHWSASSLLNKLELAGSFHLTVSGVEEVHYIEAQL